MPVNRPGLEPSVASTATSRRPAPTVRLRHWGETVLLVVGAGLVAVGFANLSSTAAASSVLLGAATAVAVVLVAVDGHRTNCRRRTVHSAAQVISQLLKSPVTINRARWKGRRVGQIVALRLTYTDLAAAAYGSQLGSLLRQAIEQTLRRRFVVTIHQPDRHRAVVTLAPPEPADKDLTELQRQQQRVRDVVGETFGDDATLDDFDHRDDTITRFAVHYRSTALKLTVPAVRRRVTNAVAERLAGSWRATFALEGDLVTFTRRPPLPTFVRRPATPPPQPNDPDYNLVPQAVDEDGNIVSWDIAGQFAHMLKAGRTRTGKTVTLTGDVMEAARRGFRVFVLDPKRVEFLGLRTWPNVQLVATTIPEQVALVHMLKLEMDERYRKVEEEGFPESEFDPILFVIDEYRQLYGNINAWWRSIKVTGMPAECPIFDEIGSLLRMAGYCRIHVDLATQRPDAAFLAGEQRDNFSARAATGRLSPDGAEMMFDNPHVGVSVPLNVRGRGTLVGVDDHSKEVQFFYTPDPRRPRNDDDRQLLAALRPPATTWPRLSVQLPDLEEVAGDLPDGKKTCLEWEQLRRATFVSADPDSASLDDEPQGASADPTADHDEDGPRSGWSSEDDVDEVVDGFQKPQLIRAGTVEVNDLVLLEERGWVCVSDVARSLGDADTQLEWRSDDGRTGDLLISRFELLEVRRPLP